MIISEQKQDLFSLNVSTIVCPVNTVGTMGNGLALYCKNKYPGLVSFYKDACKTGSLAAGRCVMFKANPSLGILLFPSKTDWRLDSSIDLIEVALMDIWINYQEYQIESLGIPAVGCGKGNLPYEDVRKSLYRWLDSMPIPVHIALT